MKEFLLQQQIGWKHIFNIYNEPLFLFDEGYNIIDCNQKALDVYGFTKSELLGMNLNDIRASYTRREIERAMDKPVDEERILFETRHIKKDNSEFPVEVNTKPFITDDRLIYIHSVRDITDRIKVQESLAASEKRYRELVDFSPMAIFIQCDNQIVYINPAGIKLFGALNEDEVIGRPVFDFIHPDYHRVAAHRINLLREGMAVPIVEEKIFRLDGSIADVEVTAKPIEYSGFPSVEVFMQDITIRKKSEQISSLLTAIVESSDDAIIGTTLEGYIQYWNKGAERIYGYTSENILGAPFSVLVPPILDNEIPSLLDRIRRGEHIKHYETTRIRRDGRLINVSVIISPVKNLTGEIIGVSSIAHEI